VLRWAPSPRQATTVRCSPPVGRLQKHGKGGGGALDSRGRRPGRRKERSGGSVPRRTVASGAWTRNLAHCDNVEEEARQAPERSTRCSSHRRKSGPAQGAPAARLIVRAAGAPDFKYASSIEASRAEEVRTLGLKDCAWRGRTHRARGDSGRWKAARPTTGRNQGGFSRLRERRR
jgi:hypothetical protein